MSYITSKFLKFFVNSREIFCNSIVATQQNSISPNYVVSKRHPDNLYPTDSINSQISLSYYLTGNDVLASYIQREEPIGISYLGTNQSGYLKDYSASVKPNNPIEINANLVIFSEFSGAISAGTTTPIVENIRLLSSSDVSVDFLYPYTTEKITSVRELSYNYNTEIVPIYTIPTGELSSNIKPNRVIFGRKQITSTVNGDTLIVSGNPVDFKLPITGKNAGIKIGFNHPVPPSITDTLTCSGVVTSKSYKNTAVDIIESNFTIVQYNVDNTPLISGFDPLVSSPGSFIKISGRNFTNTTSVCFEDREALRYDIINDTLISGIVPYDAVSGKITVNTYGGSVTYPTVYQLSYPAMAINHVSPYTGYSGQGVYISGNNFYRISHVFFGNRSGDFRYINSGSVYGYIPGYAESGRVRVVSSGRLISATSPHGYVPIPIITGISPWTGMSGDIVTLSGFGFSGITSMQFNGINAVSFASINNILLTGMMPSGNIKGYISLRGASGVYTTTQSKLNASIAITGIDSGNASPGGIVRISGYNFQSGLMYQQVDGRFRVKFNNQITGLDWVSNRLLTGYMPTASFTSGPVRIFQADGSTFENTGYLPIKIQAPSITSFAPLLAASGQTFYGYVEGTNLFNVTGIRFVGTDATWNMGRIYIVPLNNNVGQRVLRNDSLGLRVNITNYTGFVFPTGVANAPAEATGKFNLTLYTNDYSATYSTEQLVIKKLTTLL